MFFLCTLYSHYKHIKLYIIQSYLVKTRFIFFSNVQEKKISISGDKLFYSKDSFPSGIQKG